MRFAWQYLIPLALFNLLIVAVEVSVFARWDVPALVSLGIFGAVNWIAAVVMAREWARRLGYRPELEAVRRPTMTQRVGGIQAAERLGTAG